MALESPEAGDPATAATGEVTPSVHDAVDEVYRAESRRVLATLIRLLGDFDLAEEALHDAFEAALRTWPREGVPSNPRNWLISAGRFRGIDRIRRRSRLEDSRAEAEIAHQFNLETPDGADWAEWLDDDSGLVDDRLRLIFTCCHPALSPDARLALTLREVCGLTTEEIAHAFLIRTPTLAQRIVRAKTKIRDAGIPYEVPARAELPERLDTVLHVIYLVFNEGYFASGGDGLTRPDLSDEAIRLGRLLVELMPEPEVEGLLALMLLHEARRPARTTPEGEVVLLEDQDRSLWSAALIEEGTELVERALSSRRFGPFTLQAAIAAVHVEAPSVAETDWAQIVAIYDLLLRIEPSPVIELNRAVALAMRDGSEAGLAAIDALLDAGELADYHLAHAARADLCRRLGRDADAAASYRRAVRLTTEASQKRLLESRLAEVTAGP
ncbi:MAG TPA: RNA polymerase sigma factor [Longimicrobiales bacterium]|nr:RNA polymerase sigma factor [Longimicrobiales bacterium]